MLSIKNLSVQIENKHILKNINLTFELGKNYCILGKNGSGKSSLAMTIMGHPKYQIKKGECEIQNGKEKINLLDLDPNERAKLGIFLAFQHIPEIKGVKVFEFLRSIYDAQNDSHTSFIQFKKIIEPFLLELNIDKEFLRRDLNVGFSGGERRKLEILQLKLLKPKYIFLDEIDSGLDVDAFKSVANMIKELNNKNNCFIIITHYFTILDYIQVDRVYVLDKGELKKEGLAEIAHEIKEKGFNK
ncbi:Fe-S cluster assembly ATPase SufC [Candidatus Gracilibacteria bacterium]|nr:Fe-S cluster assembly ATPase SufC [Candidatus Gracilibacteria bacterium]